jgi:hypothetical protein
MKKKFKTQKFSKKGGRESETITIPPECGLELRTFSKFLKTAN